MKIIMSYQYAVIDNWHRNKKPGWYGKINGCGHTCDWTLLDAGLNVAVYDKAKAEDAAKRDGVTTKVKGTLTWGSVSSWIYWIRGGGGGGERNTDEAYCCFQKTTEYNRKPWTWREWRLKEHHSWGHVSPKSHKHTNHRVTSRFQ